VCFKYFFSAFIKNIDDLKKQQEAWRAEIDELKAKMAE